MVTHKLHLVLAQSPWLELVNDCTTKYQLESYTNITFGLHELRNWGWSLSTLLKFNIFTCLIVFWRWLISGWNYQSSIIADQQAWGWLSLPTPLFPSQSVCCTGVLEHWSTVPVCCTGAPATGSVSFFCWGCESVRGHYLPSLIHAISCSPGSKNGNTVQLGSVQKIPRAREPPQIILINCGTEQRRLPWAPGFQYIRTSSSIYPHLWQKIITIYTLTWSIKLKIWTTASQRLSWRGLSETRESGQNYFHLSHFCWK